MNLEDIMLGKGENTVWFHLHETPKIGKFTGLVAARLCGVGDGESLFKGYKVSVREDDKDLERDGGAGC